MKFTRDKSYDQAFETIPEIKWYPYIGKNFGADGRRLMIYAHNIPCPQKHLEARMKKWKSPSYWADAIDEYTYVKGFWTESFRTFVKGAAGLSGNYDRKSDQAIIDKVDAFIDQIAYINFIQDLVVSDSARAIATPKQVAISQQINKEILKTLGITHCIAWGKPTFSAICTIPEYKVVSEKSVGKKGFSSAVIDAGDFEFKLLRVYHPSMPGFSPYSSSTQKIISEFTNS